MLSITRYVKKECVTHATNFFCDLFGKMQNVICVVNTHSSLLKKLSCHILYTTNTCIAELEMHYNKRHTTNNQCSLHPQCTVHCLSVSSYVQWNCLACLSSKNIALNIVNTNLIVTQSEENFCVSEDCDEQAQSCTYVLRK